MMEACAISCYRQETGIPIVKILVDEKQATMLDKEFDRLFSIETGYDELDARIKKTKAQKEELLVVLKHPEIPLHHNPSEGGAKIEKPGAPCYFVKFSGRQDVSFQTITLEGTRSKDTMMSIVETCKKLGISAYKFIQDRINEIHIFPTLAEMIKAKAAGQPIPI